jgi:histone-lysine N-methyltransferase SETMAR
MTYKLKYCKWAPHRSSEAQKHTRVATSKRFLDLLGSFRHRDWKYLVTLDEAWFYFLNQHKQIWLPDQEDPPTIQRQTINSRKTMLTVVRNPHGFHLVSLLSKGQKWTSQYYIDHILPEIYTLRDARDRRKSVVHAYSARPHVAKRVKQYLEDNNLKSAPHPPYSPDLAPNDFFSSAK